MPAYCAVAVALTRGAAVSPARVVMVTTVLGVVLIANTSRTTSSVGGEAEVLALGNLYLMIGFLAAFPWGGLAAAARSHWPRCAGFGRRPDDHRRTRR